MPSLNPDQYAALINDMEKKETVRKRWIAEQLLPLVHYPPAADLLDVVLGIKSGGYEPLCAGDATFSTIQDLFGLSYDHEMTPWAPEECSIDVPDRLRTNLHDLRRANYDRDIEATSRIAIDLMLLAAKTHLLAHAPARKRQASASALTSTTAPVAAAPASSSVSTRIPATATAPAPAPTTPLIKRASSDNVDATREGSTPLVILPELNLRAMIPDPNRSTRVWKVRARADWGFAYGSRDDDDAGQKVVLAVVEATRPGTLSSAEIQLLTYLAVCRHLRKANVSANHASATVHGFCSDGENYRFLAIDDDGTIFKSAAFDVRSPDQLRVVFNFIVSILTTAAATATAAPSSPTATTATHWKADVEREAGDFGEKATRPNTCENVFAYLEELDEEDGDVQEH